MTSYRNGATAFQTTTVQRGALTYTMEGTGTVRANLSAKLNWQTSGQIDQVDARIGDQVKTGDTLATLFQDSTQNALVSALLTAQETLAELTSPEAIANAKLAITTAQTNVTNAQSAVNNDQYWQNNGLSQNEYANVVLARNNLDKAQSNYDKPEYRRIYQQH